MALSIYAANFFFSKCLLFINKKEKKNVHQLLSQVLAFTVTQVVNKEKNMKE